VPHISLVFRETWDRTNLNIFAFERQDLRKGALGNWIRSQRSKPKHENQACLALYQGTTSVVPQRLTQGRALAPAREGGRG